MFHQTCRVSIKNEAEGSSIRPKLIGLLANNDPAASKYAEWAGKSCNQSSLDFELRQVPRDNLEKAIKDANEDSNVSGILVYYPVFGDSRDQHLADLVDPRKDVEGLCRVYYEKMHNNERYMDKEETKKANHSLHSTGHLEGMKSDILHNIIKQQTHNPYSF